MFFVILLFALFASLFTLQKEALQFCEPFFLVGFRMSLAGLLLLAYSTLKEKNSTFKLSHIKHLIMLSTFQIYLANICEIWSLKYMESAKVCLIFSLSPFLSALIAFLVLRETLSVKKWWGMIIGFIGLIPIIFTNTSQESSSGSFFIFSYAELVLLIGVASSVYGWVILKKILQSLHYSPMFANGTSMLIGGILSLIHSFAAGENWQPIPVNNFSAFLIYSTIMCLISNIICYNLYGFLLKKFSATFMSFAGLITPIFASLFGFVFLKENITWQFFASMLLFSIGLFVFHKQEIYIANTAK
jgi:drug/metabolite transporter (DMT)-like permease